MTLTLTVAFTVILTITLTLSLALRLSCPTQNKTPSECQGSANADLRDLVHPLGCDPERCVIHGHAMPSGHYRSCLCCLFLCVLCLVVFCVVSRLESSHRVVSCVLCRVLCLWCVVSPRSLSCRLAPKTRILTCIFILNPKYHIYYIYSWHGHITTLQIPTLRSPPTSGESLTPNSKPIPIALNLDPNPNPLTP